MKDRRLAAAVNVEDLRLLARRRLPRVVFDALDGGAGTEWTMRENSAAFGRLRLRPRAFAEVGERDLGTTVLGERASMPLLLAPCGFARMCDGEAELAVARSAGRAGTLFVVSAASSYPFERIAEVATGPLWYQLYLTADRAATAKTIERVAAAGYRTLVLTVDSAISPARERDIRNKLTVPLKPSPKLLLAGLSRPRWSRDFLFGGSGVSAAGALGLKDARVAFWNLARTVTDMAAVTWDDLAWLREQWDGPLVVKGVQRGEEVPRMVELGVDGIVVSNHGGRNLDGVPATLDVLPEVVAAAGKAEVYLDGGVRRGADVLRALALGARACLVGRPYMFALGAAGEAGVDRMFELFRADFERALGLSGCAGVEQIDRSLVAPAA